MITVELFGGMCNQIFQYAYGEELRDRGNRVQYFKRGLFEDGNERHDRGRPQYGLNGFDLVVPFGPPVGNRVSRFEMPFEPSMLTLDDRDKTLCGHWQSEKYFPTAADFLRSRLSLPLNMPPSTLELGERLRNENSIAVHVRRGDYTIPENVVYHGLCSLQYYKQAREYINERTLETKGYVFSDDPDWCRANFPCCEVVSTGSRFQDFYLISQCRHAIIANSTFSWWAAWVGDNQPNRIVVAPKTWFITPNLDARDLVPERWVKL